MTKYKQQTQAFDAVDNYLQERDIHGYTDHILSILEGKPNIWVERIMNEAADREPSLYLGWEENYIYDMLILFSEYENLDLEDVDELVDIYKRALRAEAPSDCYFLNVEINPELIKEIKERWPEIVLINNKVTSDKETLLGVLRWLQLVDDENYYGDVYETDDKLERTFIKQI